MATMAALDEVCRKEDMIPIDDCPKGLQHVSKDGDKRSRDRVGPFTPKKRSVLMQVYCYGLRQRSPGTSICSHARDAAAARPGRTLRLPSSTRGNKRPLTRCQSPANHLECVLASAHQMRHDRSFLPNLKCS
jgi:hypothetical protein